MDGMAGFDVSRPHSEQPIAERRTFSAGLLIFGVLAVLEVGALLLLNQFGVEDLHHLPPAAFGP